MGNPLFAMWWRLYHNMTPHELDIEEHVVGVMGRPYRTQHPIRFGKSNYFLDFIFPHDKLVVEIDGKSHQRPAQIEKDRIRDEHLERAGFRVLRLWNWDVEGAEGREFATKKIREALSVKK